MDLLNAKPLRISLNPTYLCNFRCEFCYLTPTQLADKKKLDIQLLKDILKDIKAAGYYIEHVDLYGGEIALLPEDYLNEMHELITQDKGTVGVITNLSKINPYFLRDDVTLSVSFDFEARERHDQVLSNICMLPKPVAILMLASPNLLKLDVNNMIGILSMINNIVSVDIKPYSSNQSNVLSITDKDFEEFVKKWLTSPVRKKFSFVNKENIKNSLKGEYNAFTNNHIYINPNGKIAVLEFDQADNEFFLEMDNFGEYLLWVRDEHRRVTTNPICSACPYLGHCLTEHYRDVKTLENSCNGFRHLLDWSQANPHLINN